MFTLEQIAAAHRKMRSGADFPLYIGDLRQLGVIRYETSVTDAHTDYYGAGKFRITSPAKTEQQVIAGVADAEAFRSALKMHQQGKTDFASFLASCANSGVEKWIVRMEQMTCTYYDCSGNAILEEIIPGG